MEFRQLKYFVTVAEYLHFGKAAHKLGISQPALSQQINLLEEELVVELFDREARKKFRRVQLTPAGEYLYIEANRILDLVRKVEINIGYSMTQKRNIKLGVYKALLKNRIIEVIEDYKKKTPFTEFSIFEYNNYLEVQEALEFNKIDIGLTLLPVKFENIEYQVLNKGKLGIILPKNHPMADNELNLEDLLQSGQWLELSATFHPLYQEIEEKCQQLGINRQIVQEVTSLNLLVSLVGLGNGIAFAPIQFDYSLEPNVILKSLEGTTFEDLEICHVVAKKIK